MPHVPTIVLVHSPFLGPTSMRPLAAALLRRARPAVVTDLRAGVTEPPVHPRLAKVFAEAVVTAAPEGDLVLVGHSGAGPLLPTLAAAVDRQIAGLVLLDAGLPTPGRSWAESAPTELVEQLRGLAEGDRLPPWNTWFQPDPLPELVDDAAVRERIAAEQPRVPVAFLDEPRPAERWPGRMGYLLLSEAAYGREARAAAEAGWPVRRVRAHHLAAATEPEPVADAVLELVGALLAPPT
ncbi:hypothetical protein GCM10012275_07450 [Longimycelium tulufanense]|uniref:AB hydrolase-1 domain-containing protein n=1 Tax=Longimycelium tulufanense TaxID=907463 RepID=A0A8J3CAG2_9PSEU|nr:hypothetical protein [Longimycelium tulufanense]GGM39051.1 hypothetical protein GCM10012275_07450 [Longimycelium tulufanense]